MFFSFRVVCLVVLASSPWLISHASRITGSIISINGLDLVLQSMVGGSLLFNGVDVMLQISTMQNQIQILMQETASLRTLVAELQANASRTNSDIVNLQTETTTQSKLIAGVQSSVAAIEEIENSHTVSLKVLQANVSSLTSTSVATSNSISGLQSSVSDLQQASSSQRVSLEELQSNAVSQDQLASSVKRTASSSKFNLKANLVYYTTSGNFTYRPSRGLQFAIVELVGGGAGDVHGTAAAGYVRAVFNATQLGRSQKITVGAGGVNGTVGNTSLFGKHLVAEGGLIRTGGNASGGFAVTGGAAGASYYYASSVFGNAPAFGGGGAIGGSGACIITEFIIP